MGSESEWHMENDTAKVDGCSRLQIRLSCCRKKKTEREIFLILLEKKSMPSLSIKFETKKNLVYQNNFLGEIYVSGDFRQKKFF